MRTFNCRVINSRGIKYTKCITEETIDTAKTHIRMQGLFLCSIKEKIMAKKKSAKPSKKAPARIKHNEYIVIPCTEIIELEDNIVVCPEKEIIEHAKKMLEDSSSEHTINIYRLVKKVSTSQETKIQEIS